MRWLFALALLCRLLTPAPTWAQTTGYNANGERSVGTAMANTLDASMTRRGLTQSEKDSTFTTIRKYMALPLNNQASWILIGKALGLPVGLNLTGGIDEQFCQLQPTHSTCSNYTPGGGSDGGAGAGGSWDNNQMCDTNNMNTDFAGNMILPAMQLPDPKRYAFGLTLYYGNATPNYNTWSPLSSIKVVLHQKNGLVTAQKKLAPMYVAAGLPNFSVFTSSPAYYDGSSLKAATIVYENSVRNPNAWNVSTIYGTPPPNDYVCEGGIGLGTNNQHYLTCLNQPSGWDIPSTGVIPAANLAAWSTGSPMASCKFSKEFIRQLADQAYKQACTAYPADCPKPYERVEPEDVKTGGKDPTIRESGTTTDKTLPTNSTPTNPTTPSDPTTTPTTGPDWTNPNTAAPNPTAPTAQSIVDKAFDWGFPAITINIPSGTCPTYSADFFGHQLVLDSHCPFIETNRALISAMMLLLFTIAAGIIVLRA